jgi:hypothetical protein
VIDENAWSLRPDICSVNPLQNLAGAIAGIFRKGSGFDIFVVVESVIASKPAPTGDIRNDENPL